MSSRTFAWTSCLVALAIAAFQWSRLPTLDAEPTLRVLLFSLMGICSVGLVFLFPALAPRKATWTLLASAIVVRLVLLPAPVSDDVNRYLWEGQLILQGQSPYQAPADDPCLQSYHDHFWAKMNHRESFTAYPPGIEWTFAATAWIAYHPLAFKLLALIGDLATLILILTWLRLDHLPLRWVGFWAFNPVVLISFAAEAHFDSLMTAVLTAAMLAWRSEKRGVGWILIGAAIQIKLVCLVMIPALLTRRSLPTSWLLIPVLLLPSIPFLKDLDDWWRGVTEFAEGGYFNGPLVSFLLVFKQNLSTARTITATAFCLITLGVFIARQRNLTATNGTMVIIGALILCSPIVHFWYLSWILPLACLRPSFGWTMASINSAGYFIAWHFQNEHGTWGYDPELALALWSLPLLAFVAQNRAIVGKVRQALQAPQPSDKSIGVVIPTLNAGGRLQAFCKGLMADCPDGTELIVSDGGSTDHSLDEVNTPVITGEAGRGGQIARGIKATRAEWLMIVHADTTPATGWYQALVSAIETHPEASMFVFGQRFSPGHPLSLPIELLNELRVVFGGVAFGDQTMVVRRAALSQTGGFPEQPLMEDVEASLRLRNAGAIVYLGQEWDVSSAKWQRQSMKRFFMIIRLIATYQIVRLGGSNRAAKLSKRLYREYYRSSG